MMQSLENGQKPDKANKLVYIEVLRIIAVYLVMFNHTSYNGFFLFAKATESWFYGGYLFISIATKIAVPVFFMVSGALLLGKEEQIVSIYKKRVMRFLLVLIATTALYYLRDCYQNHEQVNVLLFLAKLYSGNGQFHLWYLYSYIGFLMMLPILRKMVANLEEKDYIYIFLCHILVLGILPVAQYVISKGTLTYSGNFSVRLFTSGSIFYSCMGYYIEKVMKEERFNRKNIIIGVIFSVLAIGISCYATDYKGKIDGVFEEGMLSETFHSSWIAVPAVTSFFCVKYFFNHIQMNPNVENLLITVGGTTFGIYLLEGILRDCTKFIFLILEAKMNSLFACGIWIFAALSLGVAVVSILKKIPGISKLI